MEKLRMNLSGSYHKGYSQHLQYLDFKKYIQDAASSIWVLPKGV